MKPEDATRSMCGDVDDLRGRIETEKAPAGGALQKGEGIQSSNRNISHRA